MAISVDFQLRLAPMGVWCPRGKTVVEALALLGLLGDLLLVTGRRQVLEPPSFVSHFQESRKRFCFSYDVTQYSSLLVVAGNLHFDGHIIDGVILLKKSVCVVQATSVRSNIFCFLI